MTGPPLSGALSKQLSLNDQAVWLQDNAIVGKCIIAPRAFLPAHLAHRSNHYFGEDLLWHHTQHIFERLSLAPHELLLPRCPVVPFFDYSACVFITNLTQLSRGRAHVMTFGALRMLPRASILFRWKICSRKLPQTTSCAWMHLAGAQILGWYC